MSDIGKNLSDLEKQGNWKAKTVFKNKSPIGIKTPLEKGSGFGETLFKMHFDIADQIQDNLKNLIMTQKGERLGFPDYGTNLRKIYSNTSLPIEQVVELATQEIKNVVEKYMPSLNLLQFYSDNLDIGELKLDNSNNVGLEFSNMQKNTKINNSKIEELNKNNTNLGSLYKITIKYSIPALNDERSLTLFINNAK